MNAEIINIGTELLLGQIVNTNFAFIAEKLAEIGVDLYHQTTVGDNRERMKEVLKSARENSDLVITTGGLGPTSDDITVKVIGDVWDRDLTMNDDALAHIQNYFERMNVPMAPANRKQAYFPKGSKTVPNPNGTALGMILDDEKATAIALPGVPEEMQPMIENHILPYLEAHSAVTTEDNQVIRSRILRFCGIGESTLQEKIPDFLEKKNPTVAPLAKTGEVHLRITAKGEPERVDEMISEVEEGLRARVGDFIYGTDDTSLQEKVGDLLRDKGLTISIAESCTGGYLAHTITEVPGSSDYFDRGLVTYSNASKRQLLDVPEEVLKAHGAVSSEVARAMARGSRRNSNTDLSVATTGIAGPGGGTEEKPVGLVYAALAGSEGVNSKKFTFTGSRSTVKKRTAKAALTMLYQRLAPKAD